MEGNKDPENQSNRVWNTVKGIKDGPNGQPEERYVLVDAQGKPLVPPPSPSPDAYTERGTMKIPPQQGAILDVER